MANDPFGCLQSFEPGPGLSGRLWSLPALERAGVGRISRLPVSLRIVLESLLRNLDGARVRESDVRALAGWAPSGSRETEVPFVVARVLLQDFTGVPLLVDLAAMRAAVARSGGEPGIVEPQVPVDLVIDHSVQVDYSASGEAFEKNLEMEFVRNRARYQFLKWGTSAFRKLRIVPPGVGICHQVNLEMLARGVLEQDGVYFPDSLVGTDSHTTMINGLGVVGWGVGGIEAEAAMLGQPVYFLAPDVVGVHLTGRLPSGTTATDLVLRVTERLRAQKVVGKFVEFFGEGAAALTVPDRATLSNMAPEYGATMGFFPADEQSCRYLEATGRAPEHVAAFRAYWQAQGLFGIPRAGDCDYSAVVELDLSQVRPSVAGPKRPQDRVELDALKQRFSELLEKPKPDGYGRPAKSPMSVAPGEVEREVEAHPSRERRGGGEQDPDSYPDGRLKNTSTLTEFEMMNNRPTPDEVGNGAGPEVAGKLSDGDVLIAAITSCTNTSNPAVMLAAGLVAKKAVERGMSVRPTVKTSLAPGSRVVTDYLARSGLQPYLDKLGFQLVGYGCTTCIGNSGPIAAPIEEAISRYELVGVSVLSGNRNFEARIHQSLRANFLMSPPLVVLFALAGRIGIDLTREAVGRDRAGRQVFLKDLWPSEQELDQAMRAALDPEAYRRLYEPGAWRSTHWDSIPEAGGLVYAWRGESTYIREPPYFERFTREPQAVAPLEGARVLAIFGDSVTTDHISPAGAIKATSPAGRYLETLGVSPIDFNSYGARRGNHEVMVRGTFANVRIKNQMVPGTEGGVTVHHPSGARMSIFDAAERYSGERVPLVVFAGAEYGTGSSRDWAAKGTLLLGVRAVVAKSYERIHRSNLVGMGVLPCQFREGTGADTLKLDGSERVALEGLETPVRPRQEATLVIERSSGAKERVPVQVRIDTPIEAEYYAHGGILPYVLRQLLK